MPDEIRLTVDFDDEAHGADLTERLHAREFEHDERKRFGDRVIVSRDAARVFFYTDSEETAREVEQVVRAELDEQGREATLALDRWHPTAEEWRDISVPPPRSDAELEQEHAELEAREAEESLATGHAEWEVRIELPSHAETVALAERLDAEGLQVVRRHRYLLAGAANEDEAKALADRLRAEAPEGARVEVEAGGEMVWEVKPRNPFAFLGGLGT